MVKFKIDGNSQSSLSVLGFRIPLGVELDTSMFPNPPVSISVLKRAGAIFSEEVSEEIQIKKVFSEAELFKMNKAQQIELIKSFDSSVKIPATEPNRVALIIKLQGDM